MSLMFRTELVGLTFLLRASTHPHRPITILKGGTVHAVAGEQRAVTKTQWGGGGNTIIIIKEDLISHTARAQERYVLVKK